MNKKVLVSVIVVLILLLLGGGAYTLSKRNKTQTTTQVTTQTTPTQESTKTAAQSLKDLLLSGVPQRCSYRDTEEGIDMAGTTYVSGGKVRADFTSTTEGKTTTGHTVYDGTTSYIWTDEMTTGYKMMIDISKEEEASSESDSTTQQGVDLNKTIDYTCSPWVVDQALFTPPTTITFAEFNIPTISAEGTPGSTGNSSACSYCNSLTGDAKTQCLTSLNCQ